MNHKGSAVWTGTLKEGKGTVSTESGALKDIPYSFKTRFESEKGSNPEELIAAGHAACFSMALSNQLATAGMKPESISTTATATLEKTATGFEITRVHLDVRASVPGAAQEAFDKAANAAKTGCPISKLFKTNITMEARLES